MEMTWKSSVVILAAVGVLAYVLFVCTCDGKFETLEIGSAVVKVEYARTVEEQARGLSNRESVPYGTGMLFIFEEDGIRTFWMKDTLVPLDIAWIDSTGEVVGITESLTPESYFEDPPRLYPSPSPVQYVLEVPAGYFEDAGVAVGDRVNLENL